MSGKENARPDAPDQVQAGEEAPRSPRVEVGFGGEGDRRPRGSVRIAGEELPVVHARIDWDFGLSSTPPRLRMEVMDPDYRFHALSGYLVDEPTARAMDALFAVFSAAAGVAVQVDAKPGSKVEEPLRELRTAVDAFRNTGLAQAPGLDDLRRLADPRGSAAWPDAEDAGEDDEGRRR